MIDEMEDNMIEVRGAYKRYDPVTAVLRDLNMSVQRGSVYAFLGPSGCGKTTLLKCIVGRIRLDAGEIVIGVKYRSQIGYMPQATALLPDITIRETLSYFGWMYGLRGSELETRKEELYNSLEMPPENRQIKNLSGGQQRRVSLCLALLNNPDLMILDEPTVGVDPLLSHNIWQYLLNMSRKNNKTILLTTHYIEEANQADKIGMMRGGCLLAEGVPTTILEKFNCDTLDEVFVELSTHQESLSRSIDNNKGGKSYPTPKVKPKLPLVEEKCFTFRNFISLLLKNLYFLKYSPLGWFLILFVPISVSILFEYSIGHDKFDLKLGIINDELSGKNCDNYNSTCTTASCKYITLLQEKHLDLKFYQDIREAHSDARRNLIWGYLHLSHNFTQSLYKRMVENVLMTNLDDEYLTNSEINIWIDMSNKILGNHLKNKLLLIFIDFLKQLSLSCNWPVDHIRTPVRFNPPIYGWEALDFNEFSMVGFFIMLEFFLPMTYAAALLDDKAEGILERSFIAGHTAVELVAAHVLITIILFLIATSLLTTICYGIFHHAFEGSIILAIILIFLVGMAGMFYGLCIALMFEDLISATIFVLGSVFPLILVSGLMWPTEGMHSSLRSISWLLPLTHATEAYRSIAVRSWTINHPIVYTGFLSELLWALAFISITIILIKKKAGIAIK